MEKENIVQMLNNRITALEDKKKAAFNKGALNLYDIFDNQIDDIKLTLAGFDNFDYSQVEEKLLESLPNLSFYFRKESIHNAIRISLRAAFDSLKNKKADCLVELERQ
jgi:hypothetical protein